MLLHNWFDQRPKFLRNVYIDAPAPSLNLRGLTGLTGFAGTAFRVDRRDVAGAGEALVMNGAAIRSRRESGRFVRFFSFWHSELRDRGREGSRRIYSDIPEALCALIEPVVEEHDCELVDVEVAKNRGTGLLRITVDNPSGDGRVAIERCVAISREVETLLDQCAQRLRNV